MNETEILEGNKLIAEFMRIPFYNNGKYTIFMFGDSNNRSEVDLHYHSSWDWLMPVVEKIESIFIENNNSFNVTIGSTNYCVIQDSSGEVYEIIYDKGETKLLTVYITIVDFIKWYNNERKAIS